MALAQGIAYLSHNSGLRLQFSIALKGCQGSLLALGKWLTHSAVVLTLEALAHQVTGDASKQYPVHCVTPVTSQRFDIQN